jgi:hypothetical protein
VSTSLGMMTRPAQGRPPVRSSTARNSRFGTTHRAQRLCAGAKSSAGSRSVSVATEHNDGHRRRVNPRSPAGPWGVRMPTARKRAIHGPGDPQQSCPNGVSGLATVRPRVRSRQCPGLRRKLGVHSIRALVEVVFALRVRAAMRRGGAGVVWPRDRRAQDGSGRRPRYRAVNVMEWRPVAPSGKVSTRSGVWV